MKTQGTVESTSSIKYGKQIFQNAQFNNTVSANAVTVDFDKGNIQSIDLSASTGDVTINFTNQKIGTYILSIKQHATTVRNVIFSPTVSTSWNMMSIGVSNIVPIVIHYDGSNFISNSTTGEIKPFNALSNYGIGANVIHNGNLYTSTAQVNSGAFNNANWASLGTAVASQTTYTDTHSTGQTNTQSVIDYILTRPNIVLKKYASIDAMLVEQGTHTDSTLCLVSNSTTGNITDETRVTGGYAYYIKNRTGSGIDKYDVLGQLSAPATRTTFDNSISTLPNNPTNVQVALQELAKLIDDVSGGQKLIHTWNAETNDRFVANNAFYDSLTKNPIINVWDAGTKKATVTGTELANTIVVGMKVRIQHPTTNAKILDTTITAITVSGANKDITLADGTGVIQGHRIVTADKKANVGDYLYVNTVHATTNTTVDGNSTWTVGDTIQSNGTIWLRIAYVKPTLNASQVTYDSSGNNLISTNTQTAITEVNTKVDTKLGDAPSDGKQYARKNALWQEIDTSLPTLSQVLTAGNTAGNKSISQLASLATRNVSGNYIAMNPTDITVYSTGRNTRYRNGEIIYATSGTDTVKLAFPTATMQETPAGAKTISFKYETGTVALIADLDARVPYTGGTGHVDLGGYHLKSGSQFTTTNKARHRIYFQQSGGDQAYVLKRQEEYWTGGSWSSSTDGYGVGASALASNTGRYSNAFGAYALQNNTGQYVDAFGYNAGKNNTGVYSQFVGTGAGTGNSGSNVVAMGYNAGASNTGVTTTIVGYSAGQSNTGSSSVIIGGGSGINNMGNSTVLIGTLAGMSNTQHNVTVIGNNSGQSNTGSALTAFGRSAGASNSGNEAISIGYQAGMSNTGNYGISIGKSAGQSNSGQYTVMAGHQAGMSNTGNYGIGVGSNALSNNTQSYVIGFGHFAMAQNTGKHSSAFGHQAGLRNTGHYSHGIGSYAITDNTSPYVIGIGYYALGYSKNTIGMLTAVGYMAGQQNKGAESVFYGHETGYLNISTGNVGIGNQSLKFASHDTQTAVGFQAGATFQDDTPNAKSTAHTNVNITTDHITINGHSFGATGAYIILKYTVAGSPISGMVNNMPYQFEILDSNTIKPTFVNIGSQGLGTHTFTPQKSLMNSTSIGANSQATKPNQVVLGSNTVTEVYSNGVFKSDIAHTAITDLKHLVTKEWIDNNVSITEGSWTPTVTDAGGGATYTLGYNNGRYVKVGNTIIAQCTVTGINTSGIPTGNLLLGGFPEQIWAYGSAKVTKFYGQDQTFYFISGEVHAAPTNRISFSVTTGLQNNIGLNFLSGVTFVNGGFTVQIIYKVSV
ncbi:hypothetical protein HYO65_gp006 [Tenacibaculum phage PTm1]|uniref:Uncharacterized protein n=1 Tax=Tenacibaculum phage PTm1 TaxID=2547425 RepID=A0A5S9HXE1_9CAUD|nr:hypothetical protein HYO65_gp006 [Tenacibaculum phage PTm1]BBI90398.1 hypothetical protein [Tenacibaculum phage PTm1]